MQFFSDSNKVIPKFIF